MIGFHKISVFHIRCWAACNPPFCPACAASHGFDVLHSLSVHSASLYCVHFASKRLSVLTGRTAAYDASFVMRVQLAKDSKPIEELITMDEKKESPIFPKEERMNIVIVSSEVRRSIHACIQKSCVVFVHSCAYEDGVIFLEALVCDPFLSHLKAVTFDPCSFSQMQDLHTFCIFFV